jgi:Flp pilus assembly protein TadD
LRLPEEQALDPMLKQLLRRASTSVVKATASPDSIDTRSLVERIDHIRATQGRAASLRFIDVQLEGSPRDPKLLAARGCVLFEWGRTREALDEFAASFAIDKSDPNVVLRLGWAYRNLGELDASMRHMQMAKSMRPLEAEGHFGEGVVLQARGLVDEAAADFRAALDIEPKHSAARFALAMATMEKGDLEGAETLLLQIVADHPKHAPAWINVGIIRTKLSRDDAAMAFDAARDAAGGVDEDGDAAYQHAHFLHHSEGRAKAIELCERDLKVRPQSFSTSLYGMSLLAAGRFREGWKFYEFRWARDPLLSLRAQISRPVWAGQDLSGKTILLRAEQGIGDIIQFIRYAPLVKKLGATVLFQSRDGMGDFPRRFPGIDAIIDPKKGTPHFDYYIHLMSLPRVFDTQLDSIPSDVPYIVPDAGRLAKWRERIGSGPELKVGIAWAGRPTHALDRWRSMRLEQFSQLFGMPGVRFYSLQKGEATAQLHAFQDSVVDLGRDLDDLDDAAAAICNLDVMVAVDTALAHLAGALGKDVRILLRKPAEWRWGEEGEKSPWYPTARLIRQVRPGDWNPVVTELESTLKEAAKQKSEGKFSPTAFLRPQYEAISRPTYQPIVTEGDLPAIGEMRHGIFQFVPGQDEVAKSLAWYAEWREPQFELLRSLVRQGQFVVQIGANVGALTVPLARAVGKEGHIIAFEATAIKRRLLSQNLRMNGIANVTMLAGLPARGAQAPDDVAMEDSNPCEWIDTLDAHAFRRVDWLVVSDATGLKQLIEGAASLLWKSRPRLLFLLSGADPDLFGELHAFGYRIWKREDNLFNVGNFQNCTVDVFGRKEAAFVGIPEEVEVDVDLPGCSELTALEVGAA